MPLWILLLPQELKDKEDALAAASSSSSSSSSPPTTRLGFKLNTEAGQSYDAFEDVDLDNSTTHHSGLFFRIKGSASSTAAIDMGKWHAAIEKIIAMKLKSAVGVLGAMAEKWQRNSPMQKH